jgi:hypothetical protein
MVRNFTLSSEEFQVKLWNGLLRHVRAGVYGMTAMVIKRAGLLRSEAALVDVPTSCSTRWAGPDMADMAHNILSLEPLARQRQ